MEFDTKQLKVLVVEDNPLAAEMMSAILRNDGFAVAETVRDGAAALSATASSAFDLAIIDLELPGTDVDAMLASMRARAPRMRLVACSAHESGSDRVNAARTHVDSVISKQDLPRSGQLLRNLCRELPAAPA